MLVYEGEKSGFINDVNLNLITDKILEKYKEKLHRGTTSSEINSWTESMQRMRGVLDDKDIPDNAGVAIEFNIPHTSNRIDFLLSGFDKNNKNSIIIVELKQWQHVDIVNKNGIVSTFTGGATREVVHPSYQAWSYSTLIQSFNQDVYDQEVGLYPCVFLHNYNITNEDPINDVSYKDYIDKAPMFGKKDFQKLRDFIKKYITKGDDKKGLYIIENGKIKPSKALQDCFSSVLKGNKEFVLINSQKTIYEEALQTGIYAHNHNKKHVMIVEGGPGTGKSVLAINLLKQFLDNNLNAFYVTKNSAPRNVYLSKLTKKDNTSALKILFKGSGCFYDADSNQFDVLIVDEAHRLNEKSGLFSNLGENQIKEIINASMFSIFFIDENQKVTLKDIGSIDEIKKYAKEYDAQVAEVKLESQFRCDGSDGYLAWLDNVLKIRDTANFELEYNYDFKIFDDPNKLKEAIIEKNKVNNKSRIVAGYCWDWIKDGKNKTNIHDITIPQYNFEISWNLGNSQTWAIDDNSVEEAGCIHTCQGLEFDYVGVIIGNDLRFENGQLVTDYTKRAKTDQSLKGIVGYRKNYGLDAAQKLAEPIIKNTYKTLMTRGMKGCYIYCTDSNLSAYLKSCLK